MVKRQVALYFGSFNPIHNGHRAVAEAIISEGLCSSVWLIVSPQNPLKGTDNMLSAECRLAMCKLAVSEWSKSIEVSDIEFTMPRPSYTADTLEALNLQYPDIEFSVVMGEDNLITFDKWSRWATIVLEHKIIIYPRGENKKTSSIANIIDKLSANAQCKASQFRYLTNLLRVDISSTEIRTQLAKGCSIEGLTAPSVIKYIKDSSLYMINLKEEEVLNQIKQISDLIHNDESSAQLFLQRAKLYMQIERRDLALNDLRKAVSIDNDLTEAHSYIMMITSIDSYYYTDTYNP